MKSKMHVNGTDGRRMRSEISASASRTTMSRADRVAEAECMLAVFHKRGEVIEIRTVDPPAGGYFVDPKTAAIAAVDFDDRRHPSAVYYVINPLGDELYDRSPDKITQGLKPLASDADVTRRRGLLLDFDVERETKISATDEELEESRRVMEKTCRSLVEKHDWPPALGLMSGNGYHGYFGIDLPANDDKIGHLLRDVLLGVNEIAKGFHRDGAPLVKVDPAVHNESRITKLPGTWSRKGQHTIDRPHRIARLLEPNAELGQVSIDQLQAVAALSPKRRVQRNGCPRPRPSLDSTNGDVERAKLMSALDAVPQDVCDDHDSWLRVLMALHSFDPSESMLTAADTWSRRSPKYQEGECARRWNSFAGNGGVTVATIYDLAKQAGWRCPDALRRNGAVAPPNGSGGHSVADNGSNDDRPEVVITSEEHDVNDQALDGLKHDPGIFRRAGILVHVVRDGGGSTGIVRSSDAPRVAPLPLPMLRERLSRAVRFVSLRETSEGTEKQNAHPPDWCSKAIHARGNYPGIRPLDGISGFPILRPDGSLMIKPGYDDATGLICEPTCALPVIPDRPTREMALKSCDVLKRLVADFPFEKPGHLATFLAALLTAIGRRAFDGPSPLFLFDANVPGSGKTLLAAIISMIVNGREVSRMANPKSDDECRKLLLALAIGGDSIVLIDNIAGTLGCASLDAALTGTSWRDRILGRSEMVDLPLMPVWLGSGNNVILGADTSRRVAHCRLNCTAERPEERDGFQIPNLREHVKEHRGELLCAGLTWLRAYFVAGCPKAALKPWGSFDGWSDLIRQAIVWIDLPDPADTREELRSTADGEAARFRAMFEALAEADSAAAGLTTAEIIRATEGDTSLRDAVAELCDSGAGRPATARVLSNRLKRFRGRVYNGKFLEAREDRKGFARWSVRPIADSADSADSSTPLTYAGARTRTHAQANRPETESAESADSASDDQGDLFT